MKTRLITLIFIMLISSSISAATITITAGAGGGTTFSPAQVNVTVGDSIKWVWATGDHTTTSTTIPGGALTWNALLDNTHQTFIYVVQVPGIYNYKCIPHETMGMVGSFNASPIGIKQIAQMSLNHLIFTIITRTRLTRAQKYNLLCQKAHLQRL